MSEGMTPLLATSPVSGGLNLAGSRLFMLSKNSDVFLAGVEGSLTSEVSSRILLLDLVRSTLKDVSMD